MRKKKLQFIVLDEHKIKTYSLTEKHIVISITSPNYKHPILPESKSRVGLLQLKFHDMDRPFEMKGKKYPVFSQEQAQAILNFFRYYKDKINSVICQCEVGISRSAAVAAGLAKSIGQDDSKFFRFYVPNRLVYRLILEEANK